MRILRLAVLILLFPSAANAGAWLLPEGAGQYLSTYRQYATNKYFNRDGKRYSGSTFIKTEYAPYAEYGLDENLTIGGSLSLQSIYSSDKSEDDPYEINLNNIELFARTALYRGGNFVVSAEPGVYVPIKSDLAINPEGNEPMPQFKLNFGYGFEGGSYIDISAAYRMRTDGELKDMMRYDFTYGHKLNYELTIMAQVFVEDTLGSTAAPGNYDLTKGQVSAVWDRYKRMSYQLGVGADIAGDNTGAGYVAFYSVWYRF